MRPDYEAHELLYRQLQRVPGRRGWDEEGEYVLAAAEIEQVLAWPEMARIETALELGCGAGQVALFLAEKGLDVVGVDISPTAVAWAQAHANDLELKATFLVADVCHLTGLADDAFDLVVDGHCLDCIVGPDRDLLLRAVHRVLRQGGIFVVRTMCDPNPRNPPPHFDFTTKYVRHASDPTVATRYIGDSQSILAELVRAGFDVSRHQVLSGATDTNSYLIAGATKSERHNSS